MASKVDILLQSYDAVVNEKWQNTVSGKERMWFLVYDPSEHRKVELRIEEFEMATKKAGKKWVTISVKNCFADWMASHDYRDEYFQDPNALTDQLETEFKQYVTDLLTKQIQENTDAEDLVIALLDVSSLFGFVRLSDVLNVVAPSLKGRMLVFFPGEFDKNHYRLLNARDGWSYLARPITV
jgi:calcineurin-like phosphoesterase family protein